MKRFDQDLLKKLYIPSIYSHKGQNGKLFLIGGSHLFHAASLWSLTVASRMVDMVFYSSVPENNQIVLWAKTEFRNGIVVPRSKIEDYIKEADCVLIGPGMVRSEKVISYKLQVTSEKQQITSNKFVNKTHNSAFITHNLDYINKLGDEGEQTYFLTKYLLEKYPEKKWVIDAGALQMMEPEWLLKLNGNVVITPHYKEFSNLFNNDIKDTNQKSKMNEELVNEIAKKYNCVVLLKGMEDMVCSPKECVSVEGGNPGMTKGGTGDVLAGLVAALACKNDLFLSAAAASFINKKAGESLYKRVGCCFNASDLANEIPFVMKKYVYTNISESS